MDEMRFDDRVAIVTGGGRGIGRAHCLELARRGASVVVNDLGIEMDGGGTSHPVAEAVVQEIIQSGGKAVASRDSVATEAGANGIARTALDVFGRIDVLVHNAGTVTFAPFGEMTYEAYRQVVSVHLDGGFLVAKAVWPHMLKQRYGRLVFTTSQAALAGLPNTAHYAVAKTGLVGLSRALSIEGAEHGIRSNALGVAAYTRMMEGYFKPAEGERPDPMRGQGEAWWQRYVRPDIVSPVVAYLAHEDCALNGEVLDSSGGHTSFQFLGTTQGYGDLQLRAEAIRDHMARIVDRDGYQTFKLAADFLEWRNAQVVEAGAAPLFEEDAVS